MVGLQNMVRRKFQSVIFFPEVLKHPFSDAMSKAQLERNVLHLLIVLQSAYMLSTSDPDQGVVGGTKRAEMKKKSSDYVCCTLSAQKLCSSFCWTYACISNR